MKAKLGKEKQRAAALLPWFGGGGGGEHLFALNMHFEELCIMYTTASLHVRRRVERYCTWGQICI